MAARTRPVRPRTLRFTLAALLIVPLVSLVGLWAFGASLTLGNALHERAYNKLVAISSGPSDALFSQLSAERLETFTWLNSQRVGNPLPLEATRQRTNRVVAAYRRAAAATRGVSTPAALRAQHTLLAELAGLANLRGLVDAGGLSPAVAFQAYSALIDDEFAVFDVSGQVDDLAIYKQNQARIQTARAQELVGREAALVAGAEVAHGQMSAADRALFASAVAGQRLLIGDALAAFSPQFRAPFQRLYDSPAYHRFAALENKITGASGRHGVLPVDLAAWNTDTRAFEVRLLAAQGKTGPPLAALASQLSNRLLLEAIGAGGLGLVAVVVSILLMTWFGRRLSRELTALHDRVLLVAQESLPGVVERLRRGQDVDVAAEVPPPAAGQISEIARVAQAFSTVQRTAVEAAVGQARLRDGVNQVFLNLSLRSQSLLHRQLALLDAMQRRTSDPAALADLFTVDHLTTRMRRHAEGLIILSGATPGRGWRDPVPAVDVVRAAVAEVEDYVRVEVISDSPAAIAGLAVNDVIHLIAELIENATAFSPPTTQVEVRADTVGTGFAVEIEDRGLGLTDSERAEINEHLAASPEFDLARSEQLGLFVVARLAGRHGIKVTLHESAYGGTRAVVLLPLSLIAAPGAADDPPLPELAGTGSSESEEG